MIDQLQREAARGQQAQDLLDNDIYKEAWNSVESAIIQKWKDCGIREKDSQLELKQMFHVLSEVRRYVQVIAETGKMAQLQLTRDSKVKNFARKIGL